MEILSTVNGKCAEIKLVGRLDTTTAPQLDEFIISLSDVDSIVFDFAKLEYISSAGLRAILNTYKTYSNRGGIKLINVNDEVKTVFEMTGFTSFLTIN